MDAKVEAVLAEYEAREEREREALLANLREGFPRSMDDFLLPIGRDVGALLNLLIKTHRCTAILEVGGAYGNSTVWFAEAARQTGGRVISLELAPHKVDYARNMLRKAGLSDYVEFVVGDAVETIGDLPGPFDFVLIDLWKDLYIPTLDAVYPKLAEGALIAADNMLLPPQTVPDALRYRQAVRSKPDIQSLLLATGQGVELSRYAKPV